MARCTHVKKARKAVPKSVCGIDGGIKVGQSYYWWKFRRGGKHYSLSPPRRSQLTQSAFYGSIYDLEDDVIGMAIADEALESVRDEVVSALEEMRDGCQENLDNLPQQLQESSILNERIENLESAISEFEQLEFDPDDRDEGDSLEDFWEACLSNLQNVSIEVA